MTLIKGKDLSLEQYLELLLSPAHEILYPNYTFPTEEMLNDFLLTLKQRSHENVLAILEAFIIRNCTFNIDIYRKESYDQVNWDSDERSKEFFKRMSATQYYKRLKAYHKETDTVWEGLTWVLDLLPHFPNEAIRGIDAYFLANCQALPDDYITAFGDWTAIIRAKYIEEKVPQQVFLNLQPKDFEYLIAELYERLGYDTGVTKASYDGGIDVLATKGKVGKKERLLIQCKRYSKNVGVKEIHALLGVIEDAKATKGVLIACCDYTKQAKKFAAGNPRIELINLHGLTVLLNQHLGSLWHLKTDHYILSQKRKPIH